MRPRKPRDTQPLRPGHTASSDTSPGGVPEMTLAQAAPENPAWEGSVLCSACSGRSVSASQGSPRRPHEEQVSGTWSARAKLTLVPGVLLRLRGGRPGALTERRQATKGLRKTKTLTDTGDRTVLARGGGGRRGGQGGGRGGEGAEGGRVMEGDQARAGDTQYHMQMMGYRTVPPKPT